jgi:hypothetical protein
MNTIFEIDCSFRANSKTILDNFFVQANSKEQAEIRLLKILNELHKQVTQFEVISNNQVPHHIAESLTRRPQSKKIKVSLN